MIKRKLEFNADNQITGDSAQSMQTTMSLQNK